MQGTPVKNTAGLVATGSQEIADIDDNGENGAKSSDNELVMEAYGDGTSSMPQLIHSSSIEDAAGARNEHNGSALEH